MNRNVYSVGQVNNYIKNMFSQDFLLHNLCVKGEVSNCKYHSSGHIYFTLKDGTGTLSAVMFAGSRRNGLKFRMKEGDRVIVTGSIEVYERSGSYQMYARQIELDGAGNLYLQFEALKKELEEMGMFAQEYKQPIPKYVRRVGIVTAPTGAAIQDIRNISRRRNPYVQLILYPALVQGDGAAESIVNGIHALEQLGVDVMIVGRGGGSIEDLWAFNEEIVARAIFECSIPIISAVGHETDWTIADFVADLRVPTPSAAAELAVFDIRQVDAYLSDSAHRMDLLMRRRLDRAREQLSHKSVRLRYLSPQNQLNEKKNRLADYQADLSDTMDRRLKEAKQRLKEDQAAFPVAMKTLLKENRYRLASLAALMDERSPLKRLSGGYAFVEDSRKKPLESITQVNTGDRIRVWLRDGSFTADVKDRNSDF